jgi:hypothetical protein
MSSSSSSLYSFLYGDVSWRKLSKSCIQEAPHSQPCLLLLLLLAHSIPHYMVMFPWRKTVQILHSRRLHIHNNVFFFLTLFITTWR